MAHVDSDTRTLKSLYDNGNGLGKKAIARELNISKNTVRKYLAMDDNAISAYLTETERQKKRDDYRDYIVHLLETFSSNAVPSRQQNFE